MSSPFRPTIREDGSANPRQGFTLSVTASSQAAQLPISEGYALRLQVDVGNAVYLAFGKDNTVTVDTTDGNFDICLPGGIAEVIGIPLMDNGKAAAWVAYRTASGTNTVRATRGVGI